MNTAKNRGPWGARFKGWAKRHPKTTSTFGFFGGADIAGRIAQRPLMALAKRGPMTKGRLATLLALHAGASGLGGYGAYQGIKKWRNK